MKFLIIVICELLLIVFARHISNSINLLILCGLYIEVFLILGMLPSAIISWKNFVLFLERKDKGNNCRQQINKAYSNMIYSILALLSIAGSFLALKMFHENVINDYLLMIGIILAFQLPFVMLPLYVFNRLRNE